MNREEMVNQLIKNHEEDLANWTNTEFALTPISALKGYLKLLNDAEVAEMYEEWKDL